MRHEDQALKVLVERMVAQMNFLLLAYERTTPSIDQGLVERVLNSMEQARQIAGTL